jgi:predicted secreted hydrolase
MRRWASLLALLALGAAPYPVVRPGLLFAFPRDHGAHPAFRTEWWYITGTLRRADGRPLGFQITFFRTRPDVTIGGSRFAPGQILFAHAALSDPAVGRLLHGERSARAGFGLAGAKLGDADVNLRDWRLHRLADGQFEAEVGTTEFALALRFRPEQPVLLEGDRGYSRKGSRPEEASYYYSLPHLSLSGQVRRGRDVSPVTGTAWMDREWSSDYLAPDAAGWDWTGLNLDDGAALMAFRIRKRDGGTLWAGGSYRRPDGRVTVFRPEDLRFTPLARWRSARTGAIYPVSQLVTARLPEGERRWALRPLFPDQELDGRAGGLPVYWEGAVRTEGGAGYLELTGYAAPLKM